MQKLLSFTDVNGNHLFAGVADALPSVGEIVCYSMEARDIENWNAEAVQESRLVSGKSWKVVHVCHDFRRMSIANFVHQITVLVEPFIWEE